MSQNRNQKKILGITGGVGAGKSTVLAYLEEKYHALILMTDKIAADLQSPGQICNEKIRELFGDEVFLENGYLDRPKLASIVFSDDSKLQILNQIVHPAVKDYVRKTIESELPPEKEFFVVESALLLEDHYDSLCDACWYIHTDVSVRKERLMRDRGYSEEKVEAIIKNQLPERKFREKCHFVIDNSSDNLQNTYEQVDKGLIENGFL